MMPDSKESAEPSVADLVLSVTVDECCPEPLYELVRTLVQSAKPKSPRFVGLDEDRWSEETVGDLANRCYFKVILGVPIDPEDGLAKPDQLDGLQVLAKSGANVGGYLRTMIRNHLEDLRRRQDPHRPAIFRRIAKVLEAWEHQGRLSVSRRKDGAIAKSSVVAFGPGNARDEASVELANHLRGWSEWPRIAARLATKGRQDTPEIHELMEHVASFGAPSIVLGDLLDVLFECAPDRDEHVSQLEVELAASSPPGMDVDPIPLTQRVLDAIREQEGSGPWRGRMLDMWNALVKTWESWEPEDGEEFRFNQTHLGDLAGLDRRRASETWKRIRELIEMEFGDGLADKLGFRASAD